MTHPPAMIYVVQVQNADGSWFYARGGEGRWVDGFHTGYILEALLQATMLDDRRDIATALQRGVDFFLTRLFTAESVPRYTSQRTLPLEVQNCAQAIQTLAKLALFTGRDLALARTACESLVASLEAGLEPLSPRLRFGTVAG